MRMDEIKVAPFLKNQTGHQEYEDSKKVKLSIVVPVYQEQDIIPDLMLQLVQVLNQMELRYEIIVVDDGSRDGTTRELQEICSKYFTVPVCAIIVPALGSIPAR